MDNVLLNGKTMPKAPKPDVDLDAEYPYGLHHRDGRCVIVRNEQQGAQLLADGWKHSPADFAESIDDCHIEAPPAEAFEVAALTAKFNEQWQKLIGEFEDLQLKHRTLTDEHAALGEANAMLTADLLELQRALRASEAKAEAKPAKEPKAAKAPKAAAEK